MATATAWPASAKYSQMGTGDATRTSVAKTQRAFAGTAIPKSTVTSVTQDMLVAYPGVELDFNS